VHTVAELLVDVLDVSVIAEATMEMSPADATPRYVQGLTRLGVTRLSLPVLSFTPDVLRAVEAPHTVDDAARALRLVRETTFQSYSVDLLFGAPRQSLADWTTTLRRAIELDVPHVTLLEVPAGDGDEGDRADQLERAMTLLGEAGYEQYELTHFAKPGHRSVHQEHYYAHGNYLGLGPGAESFWWPDRSTPTGAHRWKTPSDLNRYLTCPPQPDPSASGPQPLDPNDLVQEYILLRLRTDDGLDLDRLATQYNLDLRARKASLIDRLRTDGLIHDDPDRIRLTRRGRLLTDAITRRLLRS
jgi:oxygen-independent coproporphyrinogen-3 oxidase